MAQSFTENFDEQCFMRVVTEGSWSRVNHSVYSHLFLHEIATIILYTSFHPIPSWSVQSY